MEYLIDFINLLIAALGGIIGWVIELFPDSPIKDWDNNPPDSVNLGYITWFIPFPTMILHLVVLVSVIGIYYVYRLIGRWIKVVRS